MNRPDLPVARVVRRRSFDPVWLLPVLALALAVALGWRALAQRGPVVHLRAEEGHGIEPGDPLVYRGIQIGAVEDVSLRGDLSGVELSLRLLPAASAVARAGTRFWIVRPQLSAESVRGLDTLFGSRRVACLPGPPGGEEQFAFDVLEDPPVLELVDPRGLEVRLSAAGRAGMAPGSPLFYRGVRVGTVLSVGLAGDASGVEARVYVRPAYAGLVRENTRFWEVGGLEVKLGWTGGLDVELDSLQALVLGGVALATPEEPGPPVTTGHRFRVAAEPRKEWLEWNPRIPLGSELVPPGTELPAPVRAVLTWKEGRFFKGDEARAGWVLALGPDLLGPSDLLEVPADARGESAVLELGGERLPLVDAPRVSRGGVALRSVELFGERAWPPSAVRRAGDPEDLLLVVDDPALSPRALLADRLEPDGEGGFRVHESVSLDDSWHGACAVSRATGDLLGILLVEDGRARVAPVPR